MRAACLCWKGLAIGFTVGSILSGTLVATAQDRAKMEIVPHSGAVTGVAFSPDGRLLLSSSDDNTIKLWDAGTGLLMRTLQGSGPVEFASDGKRFLSGGEDHTVKLWDAEIAKVIRTFRGEHYEPVTFVAFSRDEIRVLSLSGGITSEDQKVVIWEAATTRPLSSFQAINQRVTAGTFSADGTHVILTGFEIVGSNEDVLADFRAQLRAELEGKNSTTRRRSSHKGWLELWDAATGQRVRSFEEGHSDYVTSLAFSRDGSRVVSSDFDGVKYARLMLWDVASGTLLRTFAGNSGRVHSLVFSHDGAHVLSGSADGTVKLWDAATGAVVRTFAGGSAQVRSIALSRDGTRVLSGSDDGAVRLWVVQ